MWPRHQRVHRYVRMLPEGWLKARPTEETATDSFWAVARPDTCEVLVGRRGWTPERYEGWIAEAIAALLLD